MRRSSPVLLSLTAAACAWAAGTTLWAQSAGLDACSVLTREEITALSGNRDPGAPDPSGSGAVTNCHWQATNPTGRVTLHSNVDPKEPKGLALKQLQDRGMKVRPIADLGDDAVFLEADGDNPSGTLFVRVDHWRIVITRAPEPNAKAESVLPTLTAFARAAIPKLRRAG